jgi:hypothetical protein
LQIANCFDKTTKKKKHDNAKDLEPIQRRRLKTHLVISILLKELQLKDGVCCKLKDQDCKSIRNVESA